MVLPISPFTLDVCLFLWVDSLCDDDGKCKGDVGGIGDDGTGIDNGNSGVGGTVDDGATKENEENDVGDTGDDGGIGDDDGIGDVDNVVGNISFGKLTHDVGTSAFINGIANCMMSAR